MTHFTLYAHHDHSLPLDLISVSPSFLYLFPVIVEVSSPVLGAKLLLLPSIKLYFRSATTT